MEAKECATFHTLIKRRHGDSITPPKVEQDSSTPPVSEGGEADAFGDCIPDVEDVIDYTGKALD